MTKYDYIMYVMESLPLIKSHILFSEVSKSGIRDYSSFD